jgi:DnaJ-class molecular chaperone
MKLNEEMDYYKILGIKSDCNENEIKQAYIKLAKLHHPDVDKSKNANTKFSLISEGKNIK